MLRQSPEQIDLFIILHIDTIYTVKFISNSLHFYCIKIHILINNLNCIKIHILINKLHIGILQGLKFVINSVRQYLYSNYATFIYTTIISNIYFACLFTVKNLKKLRPRLYWYYSII